MWMMTVGYTLIVDGEGGCADCCVAQIKNVLVTVSTQLLTPLLRNDLSVGERLMEQAWVAMIILHELGVCPPSTICIHNETQVELKFS